MKKYVADGIKIRRLRMELGESLSVFARRIGISKVTLHMIELEQRQNNCYIDTIVRIAQGLNLQVEDIVRLNGD